MGKTTLFYKILLFALLLCTAVTMAGCSRCEHVYDIEVVISSPTCTESGSTKNICSLCGEETTQTVPATGNHRYSESVVTKQPTCSEPGEEQATCLVCNNHVTVPLEATGLHQFNEEILVKATCTQPGEKKVTCSVCSLTETTEIKTTPHDFANATCESPKKCKNCGFTDGKPADHSWDSATCTESRKCSYCGKSDGSPLGHSWSEATCTSAAQCSRCGEKNGSELGHNMVNGTCTRCGKKGGTSACKVIVQSLPVEPTFHFINQYGVEIKMHPVRISSVSNIQFIDEGNGKVTLKCTVNSRIGANIPEDGAYCMAKFKDETGASIKMGLTAATMNFTCTGLTPGNVWLTFEDYYYHAN